MLKSEKKFGFNSLYKYFFTDTSDPVDSAIVKDAAHCPDEATCFIWAAVYHNISTVIKDWNMETYLSMGNWTGENDRPLLCELEGGIVIKLDFAMKVSKGFPFFELIDNALSHIVECGIFMHIKKTGFGQIKMESMLDIPTFADTYNAISVGHLQTAFYLLILGYVLAVVCFVTEIMWHRYRSKGRGRTWASLIYRQK
jgi:hypothetical protein